MINKEMEHKLGPEWFQELSNNQIVAANNLFPALEDDAENCQFKKVKYVLSAIGLHPLPKKSETMAGIRFSRMVEQEEHNGVHRVQLPAKRRDRRL